MKSIISFGGFNKYFLYILLSIFCAILNDSLSGFNYCDAFTEIRLIKTNTQDYLSWHHLIHQIFNYFGTFLFAFFFDKYEVETSKRESERDIPTVSHKNGQISLIFDDPERRYNSNAIKMMCLIIIFFWIIEEELIIFYDYALKDLDFWMFELLIITYLTSYIFKSKIFKHQKLSIWLNIFPCLLKIITIILTFFPRDNNLHILYKNTIYIPIGFILYIILITFRSVVNAKIKWLMDLRYISVSRLLRLYGIVGTIVCTIVCTITTFMPYKKYNNTNNDTNLFNYMCKIPFNSTNAAKEKTNETIELYLESFSYYYNTIFGKMGIESYNKMEILYEIIIIISGIITFFFNKYFSLLVIKYLTPVHVIFSFPIYFFIEKTALISVDVILGKFLLKKKGNEKIKNKFILDTIGDCFSFLGFLIYLEIIELNFRKFNYNLRRKIKERSLEEYQSVEKLGPLINNNNDEEEKEDESVEETDKEESEESDKDKN